MDAVAVQDIDILDLLKKQPNDALRSLYRAFYSYVCTVVYKMTGDSTVSEDIAQEVFVEVWKRRESLNINTSLKGYIRMVAVNKTLNHIRTQKINFEQEDAVSDVVSKMDSTQKVLEADDLRKAIKVAVDTLPEKCRLIFALSRYEEKTYREIATELAISIKTVENQMSKALKHVRAAVINYQNGNEVP